MQQLVKSQMLGWLVLPYVTGTVLGSLAGVAISKRIEGRLGVTSDGVKYVREDQIESIVQTAVDRSVAIAKHPSGPVVAAAVGQAGEEIADLEYRVFKEIREANQLAMYREICHISRMTAELQLLYRQAGGIRDVDLVRYCGRS